MGCCSSHVESIVSSHRNVLTEVDEDRDFLILTSNGIPNNIDDPITVIDNFTLNPLALALYTGKPESFKAIRDITGASLEAMDELLEKQQTSPFEIIFEKGHLSFLQFYLPIYLINCKNKIDFIEILQQPLIHIAVYYKRVEMVEFVYNYFLFVDPPPAFDVHAVDQETGENSALIACKNLDLPMARFLFEGCRANFFLVNRNNENALMLSAMNSTKVLNAYEFVEFLVEVVEVDLSFRIEQVLELFCDENIRKLILRNLINRERSLVNDSFSKFSSIPYTGRSEIGEEGSELDIFP